MAEYYPLRLLFKQHPMQRLAKSDTLQVGHCKRRAARCGKGTHPIYLVEPCFILDACGVLDIALLICGL